MTSVLLANRYRVLDTLGQGGFGKTFLAEDTHMPSTRQCVVKRLIFATNDPHINKLIKDRFKQEAAILQTLGELSDQIPKLYAYFAEEERLYLVQELIVGQTLEKKMQIEGRLSAQTVKDLLASLLLVLDFVHSHKKIHRDIKPDNIILRQHDSKPVLIDFGAVKEVASTVLGLQGDSQPSIIIGAPSFMAPEQAAGYPVCSSDLYSLALTAICLLTGKSNPKYMADPLTGQIAWLQYAPDVSQDFVEVLDRAIKVDCKDRYQTAREMSEALCTLDRPMTLPIGSETPRSGISEKSTIIDSSEQLKDHQTSGATPPDSTIEQVSPTPRVNQIPTSYEQEEEAEQAESSLSYCIFGNTLILIVLVFIGLALDILPAQLLPCALPWVKVPSLAVTSLSTLHLLWRFLGLRPTKLFDNSVIAILVYVISSLIERLHPRKLSIGILGSTVILLLFWIGILQWHTPSPFLIEEPTPVIDSLEVRYPGGATKSYKPGDVIQMQANSFVRVTRVTVNHDKASCAWLANGGSLTPIAGCSIQYTPPIGLKQDTLDLNVTSFCGSCAARAAFHIEVVQ